MSFQLLKLEFTSNERWDQRLGRPDAGTGNCSPACYVFKEAPLGCRQLERLKEDLARAELEEALAFLAPRMPGLAADGSARLGGVEGIYGIDELPLSWDDELAAGGPPG